MVDDPQLNVPGSAFTPDDPCKYCAQLREAYRKLITGTARSQVQYLAGGVTRMVAYSRGDTAALDREINKAEAECMASIGRPNPRRRFAIQAGAIAESAWPFRIRSD